MYRKMLLILAAIVGVAFAPTLASARGGFRGGGVIRGGGFRGGGFRGGFRGGRGLGFVGPAIGLGLGLGLGAGYYGGYYGSPYGAYGAYGCWRRTVMYTPWGPQVRRVWVC